MRVREKETPSTLAEKRKEMLTTYRNVNLDIFSDFEYEAEIFTSEKVELLAITFKDEEIEVRIFSYENGVIRAYFTYPNSEKGGEKYTQFLRLLTLKLPLNGQGKPLSRIFLTKVY
jgi:hypothetical protein